MVEQMNQLGPVRRPPDGMVHCPDCGEYLGDYVKGVLYKFGRVVTEPHICHRIKSRVCYPRK